MNKQTPPKKPAPETEKPKRRRALLGAEAALAKSAFDAAMTPKIRERLKREALVVVVSVPSQSWVMPMSGYLGSLMKDANRIARDGSQKTKDLPTEGNDQVLAVIAEGRSVIGVSQGPPAYLPSALIKAADITIHIGHPNTETLMRAIALSLGGRAPKHPPKDLGAGLDFYEIASALRPGTKPPEAVRRLQAAANAQPTDGGSKPMLPSLKDAVYYGEAQTWGLTLVAEVQHAKKTGDWSGVDRGIVHGEPGTGKTYFARILAAECNLPIIEYSIGELFASSPGYLDSVIKAHRAIFAKAAALKECILFADEIEAMPNRATLSPRNREYFQIFCDDYLCLVGGAERSVILIGATNASHDNALDPALLRPGRFERMIKIGPPATAEGLAMILRFHLQDDLKGEDLVPLARLRLGATAAEAMEMVRCARRSARTAKRGMVLADLAAIISPEDVRPFQARWFIALHESAHSVVTLALGAEELKSVSIVSGNGAAGHMTVQIGKALGSQGREYFEKIVIGTLAGRAAEILLCAGASAGAGGYPNSDLGVASRICAAVHASFGLADSLLFRGAPGSLDTALMYDGALRSAVEADLRRLHKRAEELVLQHRREIEAVAEALLERRHLEADEIRRIVDLTKAQCDAAETPTRPTRATRRSAQ